MENAYTIEIEKLRAENKELIEALKRFIAYGDIYRYKQWEENPYEQAMKALAKAEEK